MGQLQCWFEVRRGSRYSKKSLALMADGGQITDLVTANRLSESSQAVW